MGIKAGVEPLALWKAGRTGAAPQVGFELCERQFIGSSRVTLVNEFER